MPYATGMMTCSSSKSASKVTSINDRVATEIRRCCRRRCDFDGTSSAVRTDVMRQSWTLLWVMPGADNVCCRRREHGARIHLRCEERRPALQPSQWRYVNNRVKSRTWSLSIVDPWVFKYNYMAMPDCRMMQSPLKWGADDVTAGHDDDEQMTSTKHAVLTSLQVMLQQTMTIDGEIRVWRHSELARNVLYSCKFRVLFVLSWFCTSA